MKTLYVVVDTMAPYLIVFKFNLLLRNWRLVFLAITVAVASPHEEKEICKIRTKQRFPVDSSSRVSRTNF